MKKTEHENFWGGRYAYYISVTLYMHVNISKEKKLEEGRKEGRKILVLLWNLDLEIINETADTWSICGFKSQPEVNHIDYFK